MYRARPPGPLNPQASPLLSGWEPSGQYLPLPPGPLGFVGYWRRPPQPGPPTEEKNPLFQEDENFAVRQRYTVEEDTVYTREDDLRESVPHRYLSLNSLGRPNCRPRDVLTLLRQDWNKFFPFGATGQDGTNRAYPGQVLRLGGPRVGLEYRTFRVPWVGPVTLPTFLGEGNYVLVTIVTPNSLTVQTLQKHVFTGTVQNGFFRDSTGEMWMFQYGTGFDNPAQRVLNYGTAGDLWRLASYFVKKAMRQAGM